MTILNLAIIGYGLIGKKRHENMFRSKLIALNDLNLKNIKFKNKFENYDDIIENPNIDAVVICTTHSSLYNLSIKALKKNKHVFVEKPGSMSEKQLKHLIFFAEKKKLVLFIGYNMRYHPAIEKSYELFKKNYLGKLMYIKISYGHGGRVNYGKEWRFDKKISGGGELIDKGSHLIDLSIMFLGKFKKIQKNLKNYFWHKNLDDNAFLILENKKKQLAFLHASSTEWKNEFILQLYGKKGKVKVTGIGGSYGDEKCIYYRMSKKMGPPKVIEFDYSKLKDNSWIKEMKDFYKLIINKKYKLKKNYDHLEALKIIDQVYKRNISL